MFLFVVLSADYAVKQFTDRIHNLYCEIKQVPASTEMGYTTESTIPQQVTKNQYFWRKTSYWKRTPCF